MDFLLFQIIFVIILIVLAIIGWRLIRAWRRRRAERGPTLQNTAPTLVPDAPPSRGLGRRRAAGIAAEPEPARVRRRQIGPASVVETLPEDDAESAVTQDERDDFVPEMIEDADAPIADALPEPPEPAAAGAIHTATMERLEDAFARLQRGDMTLPDYIALIDEQDHLLADRIDTLESDARDPADLDPADLDDARAARDAVRWCREWAGEIVAENRAAEGRADDAI